VASTYEVRRQQSSVSYLLGYKMRATDEERRGFQGPVRKIRSTLAPLGRELPGPSAGAELTGPQARMILGGSGSGVECGVRAGMAGGAGIGGWRVRRIG